MRGEKEEKMSFFGYTNFDLRLWSDKNFNQNFVYSVWSSRSKVHVAKEIVIFDPVVPEKKVHENDTFCHVKSIMAPQRGDLP